MPRSMADQIIRAVSPKVFFGMGICTLGEAIDGSGISHQTAQRAAKGEPLRRAPAGKLERWSQKLPAAKKAGVYIAAALAVFPEPRRGRPRSGGVSPVAFFALNLPGTSFGDTKGGTGLSHNLVWKARHGKSVGAKSATALEQWSRSVPAAKKAGAHIDRVLAVWPEQVRASKRAAK